MYRLTSVLCFLSLLTGSGRAAEIIQVPPGGNLQQAIERARPGDAILLTPGATYVGNFVLPDKPGRQFITIRTAPRHGQPAQHERVTPAHAQLLAKIKSPDNQPAVRTAPGAHHWRLQMLEFAANRDALGDIIALGDGGSAQRARSQVPFELIVDRCLIRGDSERGQKRGIALNSASTVIVDSYIANIKAKGQDSQAIAGWNGPGPYTIENNYLEAASENFLLGGADPAIEGMIAEDVVFRRNHLSKRVEWRDGGWVVKNLFQLKSARRVLVEGNLMEYSWPDGQSGYAVLFTPRNQDGAAPWARIEDVTMRLNTIRHAGGGIQITGVDSIHPSGRTRRILVSDNLFYGIDSAAWGGHAAFVQIGDGPSDISIVHNTVLQSGNIVMAYGGQRDAPQPIPGFRFRDNLVRHNQYGVHGADRAPGMDTLQAFFPGVDFTGNGMAGGDSRQYPAGNLFVSPEEFEAQFVQPSSGDFRLRPNSRFRGRASDGKDLGADMAALARAAARRVR
jgi:hypothetical protein